MLLAENQGGLAVALLLQMLVGNRREGKLVADHEFVACKLAEKIDGESARIRANNDAHRKI